jgi:hypothetical protein
VIKIIDYSEELIDKINSYNDEIKSIANRILNLQINFTEEDIEIEHLWDLKGNLCNVNSSRSNDTATTVKI